MTNLSTENEQLADWLEQYDKDWIGTKGKDLTARLNRIATLIRQQSARIAALEDALIDIKEYADAIPREEYCYSVARDALDGGYVSERKAFSAKALGKGSE